MAINKIRNFNKIEDFISCVKENFELITMFKTISEKTLDNHAFKFIVLQLKDNYEKISKIKFDEYKDYIEEFDFFKKVCDMSKSLSKSAGDYLDSKISLNEFERQIYIYCSISEEWLIKYSLYLK